MERIVEEVITTRVTYRVIDSNGVSHLFHDSLSAQLMEERWDRERREREKVQQMP